jgi:hypothetical protein
MSAVGLTGISALEAEMRDRLREKDEAYERLRQAASTALGCLDDPTGGQHVTDMRRASAFLREALYG